MSDFRHLIEVAIEPKSKADRDKLVAALAQLASEDASFTYSTDEETSQTVIAGMNEEQLAEKVESLKRVYRIEANVGAPQVAYRETVTRKADVDYSHKKQTGGSGQFARVRLRIEPLERDRGRLFANEVVGGNVPKEYIPAIEKGVMAVAASGVIAGFPLIDFKIALYDGAYHDVDSSAMAFEIAARAAMREIVQKAEPRLMEPIMQVEVEAPAACSGDVASDLRRRRGSVTATESVGDLEIVRALVPLANMFSYRASLDSLSKRRGRFEMRFSHYAPVPQWLGSDDPFPPAVGMRA